MQMVNNIYHNVESGNKPIAYFSLGWQLENCIPGFVRSMIRGLVPEEIINGHFFNSEWIADPKKFKSEIQKHLMQQTDYANIKDRDLTEEEWKNTCKISTNLTPLSAKQIEFLIRHGENLTELQVKLYCPSLLHSHVH
jgi:NTE family protein